LHETDSGEIQSQALQGLTLANSYVADYSADCPTEHLC